MRTPKAPLYIGDAAGRHVIKYASRADAEGDLDARGVLDGDYIGYDSLGYILTLSTLTRIDAVKLSVASEEVPDLPGLETLLRAYLKTTRELPGTEHPTLTRLKEAMNSHRYPDVSYREHPP